MVLRSVEPKMADIYGVTLGCVKGAFEVKITMHILVGSRAP
jgi:hypothetical protein